MLVTLFAGCSDKKGNEGGSQETEERRPASRPNQGGGNKDDEFKITDILPDYLNYNNKEVTICVRNDPDQVWEIGLEDDGAALSAELFERTGRTEERLNIVVEIAKVDGWSTYNNAIISLRNSIMNQQAVYDIITGWSPRIPQLASEGLYYNLRSFDYLDVANEWWSQSLAKELTVNDRLFMATGDVSTDYMRQGHMIFFNQTLAKAMGMDYSTFYQTVSKGEWTFDTLYELSKDAYANLNGNDFVDEGDQFGLLIVSTMLQAFYGAAGINMVPNNGVDVPTFDFNAEIIDNVWTKIQLLIESPATVANGFGTTTLSDIDQCFIEGKALFNLTRLGSLADMTDMADGFGVLPMPKYDVAQESYYTQLHSCELWSIPMDAKDPDMSSAVMTSLGYDSHEVVLEPHFEKLLKTRYVKDSESGYMIDTIYYNIFMNFDSIYNEVFYPGAGFSDKNVMPMFIFGALANGNSGSASAWWAKNENNLKAELQDILKGFYS